MKPRPENDNANLPNSTKSDQDLLDNTTMTAQPGESAVVELLLRHGVSVNRAMKKRSVTLDAGATKHHLNIVNLLIEKMRKSQ